ncbi:MAG: hypothetical protein LBM65_07030 [Oscillospiraceae bacterium]|jgi:hypothetical protein|nr:hypothetical protein [Oscillospiraceae bacterium]
MKYTKSYNPDLEPFPTHPETTTPDIINPPDGLEDVCPGCGGCGGGCGAANFIPGERYEDIAVKNDRNVGNSTFAGTPYASDVVVKNQTNDAANNAYSGFYNSVGEYAGDNSKSAGDNEWVSTGITRPADETVRRDGPGGN